MKPSLGTMYAAARVISSYVSSKASPHSDVGSVTKDVSTTFAELENPTPPKVDAMQFIHRPKRHRGKIGPRTKQQGALHVADIKPGVHVVVETTQTPADGYNANPDWKRIVPN